MQSNWVDESNGHRIPPLYSIEGYFYTIIQIESANKCRAEKVTSSAVERNQAHEI